MKLLLLIFCYTILVACVGMIAYCLFLMPFLNKQAPLPQKRDGVQVVSAAELMQWERVSMNAIKRK